MSRWDSLHYTVRMTIIGIVAGLALAVAVSLGTYTLIEQLQEQNRAVQVLSEARYQSQVASCHMVNQRHDASIKFLEKLYNQQAAQLEKAGKDSSKAMQQLRTSQRELDTLIQDLTPKKDCSLIHRADS